MHSWIIILVFSILFSACTAEEPTPSPDDIEIPPEDIIESTSFTLGITP